MLVRPDNYEKLRQWLKHMVAQAMPEWAGSEIDPVQVLDGFAKKAPAKARVGLALAVGDIVEMTNDWSSDRVALVDRELREAGLPDLSEVRVTFSKAVSRVLRRGSIRSEAEYYLVRNAAEIPSELQSTLLALTEAYEA
jgi:hypothetical protein